MSEQGAVYPANTDLADTDLANTELASTYLATAPPTITYTSTTTLDFSITLDLGTGTATTPPPSVTIYASDLASVSTNGLHLELPPGTVVTLGQLTTLITWLNTQLSNAGISASIPATAHTDWPTEIQNIYNGILQTQVQVVQFVLDQDPKDADGNYPPMRFSLDVAGVVLDSNGQPKPISIAGGLLSVSGGGLGLSRTYNGAPPLPTPPQPVLSAPAGGTQT